MNTIYSTSIYYISPPLFLRMLRLVYIKVKSLFIPENIYVIVVYLKIFAYLCSVEKINNLLTIKT